MLQVEDDGLRVYLGNFGLGRVLNTSRVFGATTMRAGTPGFQAPEQLRGKDIVTSCDVYAFRAVLTELFGGKPIWENVAPYMLVYLVAHQGNFPEFDHLSYAVQGIVSLCLCPKTEQATSATLLQRLCVLQC